MSKGTASSGNTLIGVKYISFWGNIGYCVAAKRYIMGLIHAGLPLTWTPMVWDGPKRRHTPFSGSAIGDPDFDPYCNKVIEYSAVILHVAPEIFPVWLEKEKGKRIVGYVTWETDTLPSHWPDLINQVDTLLVPCQWNKEVFRRGGVTVPIEVVPHIAKVTKETFPDEMPLTDWNPFVFYLIEEWTARKAIWKTVRCYLETFTSEDQTLLVIKTPNVAHCGTKFNRFVKLRSLYGTVRGKLGIPPWLHIRRKPDRFIKSLMNQYNAPARIRFIADDLSDDQIADLHNSGNCYVSLCHAEGWGLGAFDAAASGKSVIMTGYGGQLDYLVPRFAYLVNYRLVPVRDDSFPKDHFKGHKWAEPDVNHASRLMRYVYENRIETREKGKALQEHIIDSFSEERVTKSFIQSLRGS